MRLLFESNCGVILSAAPATESFTVTATSTTALAVATVATTLAITLATAFSTSTNTTNTNTATTTNTANTNNTTFTTTSSSVATTFGWIRRHDIGNNTGRRRLACVGGWHRLRHLPSGPRRGGRHGAGEWTRGGDAAGGVEG